MVQHGDWRDDGLVVGGWVTYTRGGIGMVACGVWRSFAMLVMLSIWIFSYVIMVVSMWRVVCYVGQGAMKTEVVRGGVCSLSVSTRTSMPIGLLAKFHYGGVAIGVVV